MYFKIMVWLLRRSQIFDSKYYLSEYPDVASSSIEPILHYCRYGWREGRQPAPNVDPEHIALGLIGRWFPNRNPLLVWLLLGRWLGWTLAWQPISKLDDRNEWEKADIIFVLHEATRTGAPIFAIRLARWLRDKKGMSPAIILLRGGVMFPEWAKEFPCLPVFRLHHDAIPEHLSKLIMDKETIYFNSLASLKTWNWISGYDGNVIIHCHESAESLDLYLDNLRNIAEIKPEMIAVNEGLCGPIEEIIGKKPVLVPPAIDFTAGRRAAHDERDRGRESRHLVVGCGKASWRKGADLFCQVAATLIKEVPDIDFQWIGGEADVDMASKIAEFDLSKRVKLLGEVENPLPLLARASVLALTSRDDPFPLVALEAASCGVPIVCFDVMANGVGKLVTQGLGDMVPAFDTCAMAAAIARLLRETELRSVASQKAIQVAAAFDIETIGPSIYAVICDCKRNRALNS